jgi:hypothetical protein
MVATVSAVEISPRLAIGLGAASASTVSRTKISARPPAPMTGSRYPVRTNEATANSSAPSTSR